MYVTVVYGCAGLSLTYISNEISGLVVTNLRHVTSLHLVCVFLKLGFLQSTNAIHIIIIHIYDALPDALSALKNPLLLSSTLVHRNGIHKSYVSLLSFPGKILLQVSQKVMPLHGDAICIPWRCSANVDAHGPFFFFSFFNFKDYIAYGHCRKQSWFLTCWTLLLMACICVCVWTAVNKALHFRASARLA